MIHRRGTRQHGARILALRRFCSLAMVAVSSAPALADAPATITSLAAVHSLTRDEAEQSIPVAFDATVTYHIPGSIGLFVQDGGFAIYADAPANATLTPSFTNH
jgi:hypothetical protein